MGERPDTSLNFNPRSREGSDNGYNCRFGLIGISIHAPAKGATGTEDSRTESTNYFNPRSREGSDVLPAVQAVRILWISIHAPAKGATETYLTISNRQKNFNPRSREGSDVV